MANEKKGAIERFAESAFMKKLQVGSQKLASNEIFSTISGGILTLRAGSKERAYKVLNALKYTCNATNIGDTRTLVIHPASTIYVHNTTEQKEAAGVFEDTIRVSVGIEDVEDLIEDFTAAFAGLEG
mgnify:CR=1 FL=1